MAFNKNLIGHRFNETVKWTPVGLTHDHPIVGRSVLVIVPAYHHEVRIGQMNLDGAWIDDHGEEFEETVTHWAEIPAGTPTDNGR